MATTRIKKAGSQRRMNQSSDDQKPVILHQDVSKKLEYLLHVLTGLSTHQFSDDHTTMDMQQTISPKIDALLRVLTDFNTRVSVCKVRPDQGEASVRASTPTSPPRMRAMHQVTPTPIYEIVPENEAMSDEEEHPPEAECIRKGHST